MGFGMSRLREGGVGAGLSPPAILAKSFYHLAISCVCIPLIFFRLQGNDKGGKKSLFAFHPGVLGEGYLCQIFSPMVRGFSFPLPENREAPPESNLPGKRRKESLSRRFESEVVLLRGGLSWFPAETFGNGTIFSPVDTAFRKQAPWAGRGRAER